jgi:hypothetical protein
MKLVGVLREVPGQGFVAFPAHDESALTIEAALVDVVERQRPERHLSVAVRHRRVDLPPVVVALHESAHGSAGRMDVDERPVLTPAAGGDIHAVRHRERLRLWRPRARSGNRRRGPSRPPVLSGFSR